MIDKVWPNFTNAVVALPDPKKGEQLILVTDGQETSRTQVSQYANEHQFTELMIPKVIIEIDKLPLLGTGKVDYPALSELVANEMIK